jgi:hypothetical protein
MSDISERADRFVRSVFRKGDKEATTPQKAAMKDRSDRLKAARDRAVKSRRGY